LDGEVGVEMFVALLFWSSFLVSSLTVGTAVVMVFGSAWRGIARRWELEEARHRALVERVKYESESRMCALQSVHLERMKFLEAAE
jgi:hypothetical protein